MASIMARLAIEAEKVGVAKASAVGVVAASGIAFVCSAYIRSMGDDLGGDSPGQPRSCTAQWAAATKEYLKYQGCNPIRNGDGRLPGGRTL
jgi:hypothetical protein